MLAAEEPRTVGRITYEILRPVPIGRVGVDAAVVRPGRRVERSSRQPSRTSAAR